MDEEAFELLKWMVEKREDGVTALSIMVLRDWRRFGRRWFTERL